MIPTITWHKCIPIRIKNSEVVRDSFINKLRYWYSLTCNVINRWDISMLVTIIIWYPKRCVSLIWNILPKDRLQLDNRTVFVDDNSLVTCVIWFWILWLYVDVDELYIALIEDQKIDIIPIVSEPINRSNKHNIW